MKIIAEIPARAGSQRVKNKNLRLLCGKPMISYSIEAAKQSTILADIYVNSDSDEIGMIAKTLGVKYYKRPIQLASDTSTSDDYNYDFFQSIQPDILVQINPVNPLITAQDIDEIIQHYLDNNFDSLITVKEEKFQAFCDGNAINFDIKKQLPRTQDILPIHICAWPVCIWKKEIFMKSYKDNGYAIFSGDLCLYPVSFLAAIKVSYEADFQLAEKLLQIKQTNI